MRRLAVALGAVAVLLVGGIAFAAIPDEDGYTYICVGNGDGSIRAREKGATCPKNFAPSRLVANQTAINITNYRKNDSFIAAPNGAITGGDVSCDEGDLATGGGFTARDALDRGDFIPVDSAPIPFDPPVTGWHFAVRNNEASTLGRQVEVWVVCQHTE